MTTVAVTGASGFIGKALVDDLKQHDHEVRVVRWRSFLEALSTGAVPQPNLGLSGVKAVVHLGGRVHVLRREQPQNAAIYRRVNVDATLELARAAIAAGVETFVFVSSVGAVATTATRRLTETSTPVPDTPYGMSKLEAERELHVMNDAGRLRVVTLRFPLVYGAEMKGNPLRLFVAIQRGLPLVIPQEGNARNFLYVANAVRAIRLGIDSTVRVERPLFVSDGIDMSTADFIRAAAASLGRSPRLVYLSPAMRTTIGHVGDLIARVVPWPLTSRALERLCGSLTIDITPIRELLAYRPVVSFAQGIAETGAWFRARHATRER